jgi:hypothetical protein
VLAVVVCLIVVIQSTPSIRILLLIGTALFVIERTFGDWVADRLGATFGKLALLVAVGAVAAGLFATERGRSALVDLMALAGHEAQSSSVAADSVPPSAGSPPGTSGEATRSAPAPGTTSFRQVENLGAPSAVSAHGKADRGASGEQGNDTVISTRTTLRASVLPDGRRVDLEARVLAGSIVVDSGSVVFSADGRTLVTVPVDRNGTARAIVENLPSGVVRITARYAGTGRFGESVSAAYMKR